MGQLPLRGARETGVHHTLIRRVNTSVPDRTIRKYMPRETVPIWVVNGTSASHLTVYPSAQAKPLASPPTPRETLP